MARLRRLVKPRSRPFAALNTAYATDGVLIHVTGKVEKPVNITYRHANEHLTRFCIM